MPSIIELMRQRKAAKEIVKSREPMVRVLLALGLSLVFIVLTVVAFAPRANLSPILTMAVAMGAFVLFIYLARKNRAVSSKEQERSRLRLKSVFWSVLLLVLLLIVILYMALIVLPFRDCWNKDTGFTRHYSNGSDRDLFCFNPIYNGSMVQDGTGCQFKINIETL